MKLTRIQPDIFHIEAAPYPLAMMFWRATEFKESPKFAGTVRPLTEYMEWYAGAYGEGVFTYPEDWHGFNIELQDLRDVDAKIPDLNHHDVAMRRVREQIEAQCVATGKVSIIGTRPGDDATFQHEMAHAFYAVRPEYKARARELITEIAPTQYVKIKRAIEKLGYHGDAVDDELQAYASTGLDEDLVGKISKKTCQKFEAHFKQWSI